MNAVTADELTLEDLMDPRERTLGSVTLVAGAVIWAGVLVVTHGYALAVLLAAWLVYMFLQSAMIAHLKGNGVELCPEQLPELHARLIECCERLRMKVLPEAYIVNGNGVLNTFATHFLREHYIILTSDVVDAMLQNDDGLRFYIGHELGRLRVKHVFGLLLRGPALWLPLVGAAYSRARQRTCDRHGNACSGSPEASVRALAALAAGRNRWRKLNLNTYVRQTAHAAGFWMSFHELVSGYPWLTRRAAYLMGDPLALRRNPLAYIPALFVPFGGRLGAGVAFLAVLYAAIVAALVLIPQERGHLVQSRLDLAMSAAEPVRMKLEQYYASTGKVPGSLTDMGVEARLPDGSQLTLDPLNMRLTIKTISGELILVPSADDQRRVTWMCRPGAGVAPEQLPTRCNYQPRS